jgi:hypothetical protein
MRLASIFCLILGCVFLACNHPAEKKPEDILAIEQMVSVMADIQLAEAAISVKNLYGDSAKRYAQDCYDYIYKEHRMPKALFEKSLNYYLQHPKELDLIYTEVISELSEKDAKEAK